MHVQCTQNATTNYGYMYSLSTHRIIKNQRDHACMHILSREAAHGLLIYNKFLIALVECDS